LFIARCPGLPSCPEARPGGCFVLGPDGRRHAMAQAEAFAARQEDVACFCCGELFGEGDLVRFGCHPESGVCVHCAGWRYKGALARGREVGRPVWLRLGWRRWRRGWPDGAA